MNHSPTSHTYTHSHFNTPSRKPSEHHCNADKKLQPTAQIDPQSLAPLCRILFQDPEFSARPAAPAINTKLLRWFIGMIIYLCLDSPPFLTLYNQWILKTASRNKYSAPLKETNSLPTSRITLANFTSNNTSKFILLYLGKSIRRGEIFPIRSKSWSQWRALQYHDRHNR